MPARLRDVVDKIVVTASRASFLALAGLAFLALVLNVFLPLEFLERGARGMIRWARKRAFIKRGFQP